MWSKPRKSFKDLILSDLKISKLKKQNYHIIQKAMFHVQVKVKRSFTRLILLIPPPLFSAD